MDNKKLTKNLPTEKPITPNLDGILDDSSDTSPHIMLSLFLKGNPGLGDWLFLLIFNGEIVMETKWEHLLNIPDVKLPLNFNEAHGQTLIADKPLIFILRTINPKGSKEQDPILHADNKAGSTVDLFPLILGENEINITVPLISMQMDLKINCQVEFNAKFSENFKIYMENSPLIITMLSAHCLPPVKDGTVYISAMELHSTYSPPIVNFGMSLSHSNAKKVLWASASNGGQAASTSYNVPIEDLFIPLNLEPMDNENCLSVYWNAMSRVLVDSSSLRGRLKSPFVVEVAAVPRQGKVEVRGRFMAFVDAGALLEAGQFSVTVCAKLLPYNEASLPEDVGPLLELPPTSAKTSARDPNLLLTDEYGHFPYIIIRFDLGEILTPKNKLFSYFEILGLPLPKGVLLPIFELEYMDIPIENKSIDAKSIRKEAGALKVHEELNELATKGSALTNQSMKRNAANHLSFRIRSMIKQFGLEINDNWYDIVTAQHRTCLRSVLASFAPQPPPPKLSTRTAVTRSLLCGDIRIANERLKNNLKANPGHPRMLCSKALRCFETRNESEGRGYLIESLNAQPKNRYLLWMLGGIDFDKYESKEIASAAFHIAAKGNVFDGITGAIAWAALHTLAHFWHDHYAQFIAAKRMRKYFELEKTWDVFIERWVEESGEEEIFWDPKIISTKDPLLLASAFFLCLRCFKFSQILLRCLENGCSTRGSRFRTTTLITSDIWYLRAATRIIRNQVKEALELTQESITKFGPSASMSQMRAICLIQLRGWDKECEDAVIESDLACAKPSSFMLYKAAKGKFQTDPETALQYAARAHKNSPTVFSALLIGRIYEKIGDEHLAEAWAAAAVNAEPLLADGWAFLAILAIKERNIIKAKSMIRTSAQVGPLSSDIEIELNKLLKALKLETLPESLVKNVCFCDYY